MGEQNQVQKIEKYNENKVVRVSQELYQLDKIRWRMSTLGYRLLFAISQSGEAASRKRYCLTWALTSRAFQVSRA